MDPREWRGTERGRERGGREVKGDRERMRERERDSLGHLLPSFPFSLDGANRGERVDLFPTHLLSPSGENKIQTMNSLKLFSFFILRKKLFK